MLMTTEVAHDLEIEKRLGVVTSECILGVNVMKDYFTSLTDFIGGRSKTAQKAFKQASDTALTELQQEAKKLGADAVVGIDIDYNQFSGHGKSMVLVVATGTAVRLKGEQVPEYSFD